MAQYIYDALKKEEKLTLLSNVPFRVLCTKGELEYNMIPNKDRTVADKLSYYQSIINSLRVHDFGDRTQMLFTALYKQGVLFDHTEAAICDGNVNPHADQRSWKEIATAPVRGKTRKKITELDFLDMWLVPDKPQYMKEKKVDQHE